MSDIALRNPSAHYSRLGALPAWLRQMHTALSRPIPHDVAAGHAEFARMVDRGISHIRLKSLDPRI